MLLQKLSFTSNQKAQWVQTGAACCVFEARTQLCGCQRRGVPREGPTATVQFQLLSDVSAVKETENRAGVNFSKYWFGHSGISTAEPPGSVFEAMNR